MATNRTPRSNMKEGKSVARNVTFQFNDIDEPGTYYSHTTGWLYRMPEDSLSQGHSPVVNIVTSEDHYLTKISDDPWVPIGKARELCANMDFDVNF